MENEPSPAGTPGKREFIWKKGVRDFGIPVALIVSVWTQVRSAEPGTPILALIPGVLVGAAAGAVVGGGLFGWIMWSFFGRRSDGV